MTTYSAVLGQSIYDVCLNTYGTLDLLTKLMQDNDFPNINAYPVSNQQFIYDETLSVNQTVQTLAQLSNTKYATAFTGIGTNYYTITGDGDGKFTYPANPETMVKYQQVTETQYTAVGGEVTISLPGLVGFTIIQITKETKPLLTAEYSWNASSAVLTLSVALYTSQTLFILTGQIITS